MKPLIKLAYRQVIDSASTDKFEKLIFNDTYMEYLMQVQAYNNQGKTYATFRELSMQVPKSNSLHYKVGFAIGLYIRELNNKIPGLWDTLEHVNITFATHRFEIIDSDITKREGHRVAITYLTEAFTYYGNFGEWLLLSAGGNLASGQAGETFMMQLYPNLSIVHYQK